MSSKLLADLGIYLSCDQSATYEAHLESWDSLSSYFAGFSAVGLAGEPSADSISPAATLLSPLSNEMQPGGGEEGGLWSANSTAGCASGDVYWFDGFPDNESEAKNGIGGVCITKDYTEGGVDWADQSDSVFGSRASGTDEEEDEHYRCDAGEECSCGDIVSAYTKDADPGGQASLVDGGNRSEECTGTTFGNQSSEDGWSEIPSERAKCEPNATRGTYDMYTPRWIRGIGKGKEGLCPACFDDGKFVWRRMKCSAYWYHLNYFHGISSLTGRPFPKPESKRTVQDSSGRQRDQGLCHICDKWVYIDSSRKVQINVPEIYWWKHVQACMKKTWKQG
ncbi:hypothetical protein GQ54DRAFT_336821 [Martensiomyces pterosporus]|nr:hypothetical protein GQ54DRAFT_336821 [Martensiomyces pterosporus]